MTQSRRPKCMETGYSRHLTQEQRRACIAAGAKRQTRPRLGQSGPLTGQQYWVHKDAVPAKPAVKRKDVHFASQPPQSQRLMGTSSDQCRASAGPLPERPRGSNRVAGGIRRPAHAPKLARNRTVSRIGSRQYWRIAGLTRPRAKASARKTVVFSGRRFAPAAHGGRCREFRGGATSKPLQGLLIAKR